MYHCASIDVILIFHLIFPLIAVTRSCHTQLTNAKNMHLSITVTFELIRLMN